MALFLPSTSPAGFALPFSGPRNDLCDQLDSSFSLAPRHNSYPNCRLSSFPPAARSPGSSSIRSAGSLSPPDVASSLMVVVLFVVFPPPSPQPPSRRCGHPLCELTLPRPDFVGDFGVPSTFSIFFFNANELWNLVNDNFKSKNSILIYL